ncbi:MAG: 30S ribosomal protein S9 [candidate division Zixibacteria bacterium DG_27]|nr:MAG: 30S ribosomal protein S9 [candidate division Zixibacteria bacterium DG_27]
MNEVKPESKSRPISSEAVRATGRRKTAVAAVSLSRGEGEIKVNNRRLKEYFRRDSLVTHVVAPLEATGMMGKVDIRCRAHGGGMSGQAGALRLGIARALARFEESSRRVLRKEEMLTRDPRMVERKKYGMVKARKRFQFSKR